MPRIFISYRRNDSAETAAIVNNRMEFRFGPDNVFFDREDIKPGDTFDERIRAQLEDADVVLAVIGPRWVDAADKSGNQRLKNPHDWVALELRTALEDDKHIIPVLVDDAQPPRADALPEPLRRLANIHAHSISPHSTPGDITELIGFIEKASTGEDPEGAITFLFTDIEGSSAKWEQHLGEMRLALERHDEIIEEAVKQHSGDIFAESGDGVSTVFHSPVAALQAAVDGQRALQAEPWGAVDELSVRMAIHTGAPQRRRGNYFGPTLNRTARLLELASGGQILVSNATEELVHDRLPTGIGLEDRGTHPLRSLSRPEHVFQLSHRQLVTVDTPLRTKRLPRRPLATQLARLIGRDAEVTRARELLGESRLLTLTGFGGVGKTKLALAVAISYDAIDWPDGVHVARLETVKQTRLVIKVIADALEIRERLGQQMIDLVIDELADRTLLLVIDNCEHLINACARTASAILESCPGVSILATSREALGIPGEVEYPVPGLAVPPDAPVALDDLARIESVALFLDRATATNPSFALTDENARYVAGVCRYLEGIPLAIELAAASARARTPAELYEELEHPLQILRTHARAIEARHSSIEATINWSVKLLAPHEKRVFFRLAVLEGSFSMGAAKAIAADNSADVADAVLQLVAKSLLTATEGRDGRARYRMLATLREYGRERLAGTEEWDSLGKLHAEYFLALAEHFVPELQDADQRHARDDLDLEHDNLRAAMDWAVVNRNREIAGRLALALQWFWYWGGHVQEGHDSMSRVLEVLSDDRDGLRGYVSMGAGILADVHGELETANARLGLALELGRELDDPALVARALAALGVVAKDHGQLAEAAARFEESIEAQQSLGGEIDIETTVRLGEVCYLRGDHAAARRHLESAYSAAQRLGRTGEMAWAARHIGELMRRQGLTGEARRKLQEAVETYRTIDYPPGLAWSRLCLGILEKEGGRADRAAEIVDLALDGFRAVGDQRGIPYALLELAELARERGDLDEAYRGVTEANDVAGTIGDLRAVAWSNWETAMIARARGRPDYQRLRIALDQFQEVGDRSGAHAALRLTGRTVADAGDLDRGTVLLGAAATVPGAPQGERLPVEAVGAAAAEAGVDSNARWKEGLELDVDAALDLAVAALSDIQRVPS